MLATFDKHNKTRDLGKFIHDLCTFKIYTMFEKVYHYFDSKFNPRNKIGNSGGHWLVSGRMRRKHF